MKMPAGRGGEDERGMQEILLSNGETVYIITLDAESIKVCYHEEKHPSFFPPNWSINVISNQAKILQAVHFL